MPSKRNLLAFPLTSSQLASVSPNKDGEIFHNTNAPEILNILAFSQTFRLDSVAFCKDSRTFRMFFLPNTKYANERFEVSAKVFQNVCYIRYTEGLSTIAFKVEGEVFISPGKEGLMVGGRDMSGMLVVAIRVDLARFPSWITGKAGYVELVLKNRTDFPFTFTR